MSGGQEIAGRFVLGELAARGGMGEVWRATDRQTGRPVALKRMTKKGDPKRFLDEGALLAHVSHPRIVGYVAHGLAAPGEPFLAMEWLDGEDLKARLARDGLSLDESIALVRGAAEALAAVHSRGVVHRDLKPSNLFLEGGDPARVRLLDFGVARSLDREQLPTSHRAGGGTLGYMAPEEAQHGGDVDARADVFSLGCVLFECLTGRPAFAGDHAIAILAKVLMEDTPRPSTIRETVSDQLDEVCLRLLAKHATARPADGAEVIALLDGVGRLTRGRAAPHPRSAISTREQRFVSVLLVDGGQTEIDACTSARARGPRTGVRVEGTDGSGPSARADHARAATATQSIARRFGGEATLLAGGIVLVRLEETGGATERAARAAGCALAIAAAEPDATIALATGAAEAVDAFPVGPVIDRAAALLRASPGVPGVRIDDATEALLGGRFEVRRDGGTWLVGVQASEDGARMLLGRPTECVGRDRELALLESTFAGCVASSSPRAVLVTAPPGTGKSRLRYELVSRLRATGAAQVLFARADAVGAGSSFALARNLVRSVLPRDPSATGNPIATHAALREHLNVAPERDRARLAEMLGELAGAPTTSAPSLALLAARSDPRLFGDGMRRAIVDWLDAECAARPVAVVLEDLHWGDLFTVLAIDDALKRLTRRPLFVLALARPEIHETFPAPWLSSQANELRLSGLDASAAEMLARSVLGDGAAPEVIERVVRLADGNAFYLEELLRRASSRADHSAETELPDTVLAMVQARLAELTPDARLVLRAASVFGERFRPSGVAALLGGHASLDRILQGLRSVELIEAGTRGELQFRHALLRDASYAMLTDADRRVAHRVAAETLVAEGEHDARVVAWHFEHSDEPARAVAWLVRAAEAAFAGSDMRATLALTDRAIALGAEGEPLGGLHALEAIACTGVGEHVRGHAAASAALARVTPGGDAFFLAAASQVLLAAYSGRAEAVMDVLMRIMQLPPSATPPSRAQGLAMLMLCSGCYTAGQPMVGKMLLARAQSVAAAHPPSQIFLGWLGNASSTRAYEDELGPAWEGTDLAARELEIAGDELGHAFGLVLRGVVEIECGAFERAIATQEAATEITSRSSASFVREWNLVYLGRALGLAGRTDAAIATLTPLREVTELNKRMRAAVFVAEAMLVAGDVERADREATALVPMAPSLPGIQVGIASVRARAAIARGDRAAAVAIADEAIAIAERIRPYPLDVSFLHAARCAGLEGDPRHAEALAAARARVAKTAATLEMHSALRAAYLALPAHALE